MITLDSKQFRIDLNNFAETYRSQMRKKLGGPYSYVDSAYIRDVLTDLDSFAACIKLECLTDMTMLHNDVQQAEIIKDAYETYGDYCLDVLKQAYNATNECLTLNNKLYYDLQNALQFEHVDIAVSSGYVAFNSFSGGATVELINFKRMTGLGLCYDIRMKQQQIITSNIQEKMQSKLINVIELSELLSQLHNESEVYQKLDAWSEVVNDKLLEHKIQALPAWNAVWNTYKEQWFQLELTKQNAVIYCSLSMLRSKFTEQLFRYGKTKRLDYGTDHNKVVQLDYFNNSNFEFK